MTEKLKGRNFPNLRFKDSNGDEFPHWNMKYGNEIFQNISDKNHDSNLPILAITQEYGAIPRDLIDYKISVTDKSIESYKVVQKGDFIISLRSFQGGIEYSEYKGICSPAYIILRPSIVIDNIFYKYYLKTPKYITHLNRKLEGIRDGKMISYKYFSDITLPLPSLEEQNKISIFLSLIETRIHTQRKIIEQLETLMKGNLEKIFCQKLRFKDNEGNYFSNWKSMKLHEICEIKKGEQLNKDDLTKTGNYPCLNGGMNYSGYTDNFNSDENTITISEGGNSCGFVSFMKSKFWLGGHCYKVILKKDISTIFFFHLLKFHEQEIMNLRVGSGLPNIQQKDLKDLKLLVSNDSEEQSKIAHFLSSNEEKIETEKKILAQYELQKKYLLATLFV